MDIIWYHKDYDCYRQGDIVAWARAYNIDYIVELHRNAFNGTARGYETIINSRYSADMIDRTLHNALVGLGFIDRGIKGRSDLANCNRMAGTGIGYSLLEIEFIDNAADNAIYDNKLAEIGQMIFLACKNSGVRRLGVICGHGQGDPGASALGRTEAVDVRKINVTQAPTPTPVPKPEPAKPIPLPSKLFKLEEGDYLFINKNTGMAIDCSLGVTLGHKDLHKAQLFIPNGSERQKLRFDGKHLIAKWKGQDVALDNSNHVLDTGNPFCFYPLHVPSKPNQEFVFVLRGYTDAGYPIVRIINVESGRCVDNSYNKAINGNPLTSWPSEDRKDWEDWIAIKLG